MNDKLKKYTHKEINQAAMAARIEAERIHTLEAIRQQHPINTNLQTEATLGSIGYHRYEEYPIQGFIHFLKTEVERGATHINFEFYDDDSSLLINSNKMKSETPQEWMDRVTKIRDRMLDQIYGTKQREMLAHNEKIDTYLRLKKELGE